MSDFFRKKYLLICYIMSTRLKLQYLNNDSEINSVKKATKKIQTKYLNVDNQIIPVETDTTGVKLYKHSKTNVLYILDSPEKSNNTYKMIIDKKQNGFKVDATYVDNNIGLHGKISSIAIEKKEDNTYILAVYSLIKIIENGKLTDKIWSEEWR